KWCRGGTHGCINTRLGHSIAIPVAGNRQVSRFSKLEHLIAGIELSIAVHVERPVTRVEGPKVVDPIAIPVAYHWYATAEFDLLVDIGDSTIAIGVEDPDSAAVDTDGGNTVAVPVSRNGVVPWDTVMKYVVDQI